MTKAIVARKRDIESASVLLRPVLAEAEALWIPASAIAEVLVEELRRVILKSEGPDGAAAYLRALADEVEAESQGARPN